MIWQGSIETIPSGWFLCDGENDTPDLRDKFILGAGPGNPIGDLGGSSQHNHDIEGDGHDHNLKPFGDMPVGSGVNDDTDESSISATSDNTITLPPWYAFAYIQFQGE